MLTIREITVAVGDRTGALTEAGDPLRYELSPQAHVRADEPADKRANSMWLGSPEALRHLGLERGAETTVEQSALALQGRHATTGAQVRRPWSRQALDASGQARFDEQRRPLRDGAVSSVDLTFWAPSSVSWVWSQAGARLRAQIEHAVVTAANMMLGYMTHNSPVVGGKEPARGFAASVTLHATVPVAPGGGTPPPMLHMHCYLVGVLDAKSALRGPSGEALCADSGMRVGGAVGRAALAEELRKLGFRIEAGTGPGGRFFEIVGVPQGLVILDLRPYAQCRGQDKDASGDDPWS